MPIRSLIGLFAALCTANAALADGVLLQNVELLPGSMIVGPVAAEGGNRIERCGFVAVGVEPKLAIYVTRRICAPKRRID